MKISKILYIFAVSVFAVMLLVGCEKEEKPTFPTPPTYDMSGFAKGADVSWLTQMEKTGKKFYDSKGSEREVMELLRELGMNSIRLRVWVNPEEGWNNAQDVLIKAWRAKNLGMRVMIDFHYSDTWADPANQNKPEAWRSLDFEGLKNAVTEHTASVLQLLKSNNIDVEWVQIGNETRNGMLWNDGKASENMKNYAELTNAGYDAAKAVYPNTKVIVHIDHGQDNSLYRWIFDGLKENGGKWDVVGMSLYPDVDNWQTMVEQCADNMIDMVNRYGSEVMLCEVGMNWDEQEASKAFLTAIIAKTKAIPNAKGLGVFYWEPQSYAGWNGYTKGAFDDSGAPTIAFDAFKN